MRRKAEFCFLQKLKNSSNSNPRDILRSLLRLNRFADFVKEVPQNLINDLENNEQQAGEAVCDILAGNFPAFLQDVASSLSSEAESELNSLVGFVGELPKLAPEILGDLEQDAEDVVSVVGELVTNPGAAITVIVGGVESVVEDIWGDIETIGGEIITGIECLFGDCPTAAVSTPAEILALKSSCLSISAAAATAPALTTTYPAEPTTTTAAVAPTTYAAAPTTTVVVVAVTSQEPVALSSETSVEATFPKTIL